MGKSLGVPPHRVQALGVESAAAIDREETGGNEDQKSQDPKDRVEHSSPKLLSKSKQRWNLKTLEDLKFSTTQWCTFSTQPICADPPYHQSNPEARKSDGRIADESDG